MKNIIFPVGRIVLVSLFLLVHPASRAADLTSARLRSHQIIQLEDGRTEKGFLLYVGQHKDRQIVVLAANIGSAIPSQDLRLYVQTDRGYRCFLRTPILLRHGFRCTITGNTLNVFLCTICDSNEPKKGDGRPLITIDLDAVVLATSTV